MGRYLCPVCTVCGPTGSFDQPMAICAECKALNLDILEEKLIHFMTITIVPYAFEMNSKYFHPEGKVRQRLLQIAEQYQPQRQDPD